MRYACALAQPVIGLAAVVVFGGCSHDAFGQREAAVKAEPLELGAAKLNIEHNATANDTGFQGFADGEPWSRLRLHDADGHEVLEVSPHRDLADLGLTELFFETNEPDHDEEQSLEEVLAVLPAGDYQYVARSVDGERMVGTALLTHDIPAGPTVVAPADGAVVDSAAPLVVDWDPVGLTIDGDPVTIIAYQLIVENEEEEAHPEAFAKLVFSVHVRATVTSVTVPPEFLEPDADYKIEVLAIEESGNQTITERVFTTAP